MVAEHGGADITHWEEQEEQIYVIVLLFLDKLSPKIKFKSLLFIIFSVLYPKWSKELVLWSQPSKTQRELCENPKNQGPQPLIKPLRLPLKALSKKRRQPKREQWFRRLKMQKHPNHKRRQGSPRNPPRLRK